VRSLRSGLGVCAAADAAGLGSGAFQWWKMRPSGTAGDTTKQTGPNTYEGSTGGPGGTSTYKTTISADGKTMTVEGTSGPNAGRSVFDRVK
jgi:hypothetical protein